MTVAELITMLESLPERARTLPVAVAGHRCHDCWGDEATEVKIECLDPDVERVLIQ